MPLLAASLSCASSFFSPSFVMSSLTHSLHIFLPLPLFLSPTTSMYVHANTQSSLLLCSACPNHLSLTRLTTSVTLSMPKYPINSSLDFLFFNVTPHIHCTIILSVLSSLCISSIIAHVSLPYTITLLTHVM